MTVTVHFLGICTHFAREMHPQLDLPAAHRVVLVNAHSFTEIDFRPILPHVASMQIDDQSYTLAGCRLWLRTPDSKGVFYDKTFCCVPNLTDLVQRENEQLGPPSPAVVTGSVPHRTAAYFDCDAGTFSAAVHTGAVYTTLTVPSPVLLEATPFPGTSLPDGLPPSQTLTSSEICVLNVDVRSSDKSPNDFLLHYRTAEHLPRRPPIPSPEELQGLPQKRLGTMRAIGSGCSNSNYP